MAIKVNGTTVINDSRALTNIASVDATTVAAIGAAGVGGGGWSLISETAITSNVSAIDVTFPSGYLEYIVEFPRLFGASTNTYSPLLRVFDGSGNLVTSDYRTGALAGNNVGNNNFHSLSATFYSGSDNTGSFKLHFYNNPRSSNTRTLGNTFCNSTKSGSMQIGRFAMDNHFSTTGMRFFSEYASSGAITSASHDYKVWGLKA